MLEAVVVTASTAVQFLKIFPNELENTANPAAFVSPMFPIASQ